MTAIALYCNTSACAPPSPSSSHAPAPPACACPVIQETGEFVWSSVSAARSIRTAYGLDWLFMLLFILALRLLTYMNLRRMKIKQR